MCRTQNQRRPGSARERGRLARAACSVTLLAAAALMFPAGAAAQPAANVMPQGLAGILPPEAPIDIDYEALTEPFRQVSPEWVAWGEQTAEQVVQLYSLEGQSVAEQRQLLAQLRQRANELRQGAEQPKNQPVQMVLTGLAGKLTRRLDVAEAILNVLDQNLDAQPAKHLPAARQEALAAVNHLRDSLRTIQGGESWLAYARAEELAAALLPNASAEQAIPVAQDVLTRLEATRRLSDTAQREFAQRPEFTALEPALRQFIVLAGSQPLDRGAAREQLSQLVAALERYERSALEDDARAVRTIWRRLRTLLGNRVDPLAEALRTHYFGFNVQIFGSENFLNQLIQQMNKDQGPVCDFILGAQITGCQWTTSAARLDLLPSPDLARYELQLQGVTSTQTTASTRQARVYSSGVNQFWAFKEILFNGHKFDPLVSRIDGQVNSEPYALNTNFSNIPILGHIADKIAWRRVRQSQTEGLAIGRQHMIARIGQDLDEEVRKNLDRAETNIQDNYARWRAGNIYPETQIVNTTDTMLRSFNRVWDNHELGGGTVSPAMTQTDGGTAHVHESFLNHTADQLNIHGRTMNAKELQQEIERYLTLISGRQVKLEGRSDAEPDDSRFVFPMKDPLRFQISEGKLLVMMRAGLLPTGREPIPTQIVTVEYHYRLEGDSIVTMRDRVLIEAAEDVENPAEQAARAAAMREPIEKAFPAESRRSRKFVFQREDRNGSKTDVPIWVTRIELANGWATVWMQPGTPTPAAPTETSPEAPATNILPPTPGTAPLEKPPAPSA